MKNSSIPFNLTNIKLLFSKNFLLVILISIPSAILADYFRIPLAWMLGPMLAISVAALMGVLALPFYLADANTEALWGGALLMGATGTGVWGMAPAYLMERFPTAVRGVGAGLLAPITEFN